MYERFYGLREKPFSMTPDPDYLFFTEKHREAYAHLVYGIRERGGFIEISGEVGAGKTTLCRALLNEFDENTRIALILNPMLSDVELLRAINDELCIRCEGTTKKELLDALNRFLIIQHRSGRNVVLLIDEAQNLSEETLEQVRIISNLETVKAKLVQIVLVGQPELREKLAKKELRQLDQRITVRYHLGAMDRKETEQYIAHRLKVAGGQGKVKFTAKALKVVYAFSGGIPRKVNTVCDHALLSGYVAETSTIDDSIVERAIREITGAPERKSTVRKVIPRRALALAGTLAAGLALAAGSFYLVKNDLISLPNIEALSGGLFASAGSSDSADADSAAPDVGRDAANPADSGVPGKSNRNPGAVSSGQVALATRGEPAVVLKPPVQSNGQNSEILAERSLPTPAPPTPTPSPVPKAVSDSTSSQASPESVQAATKSEDIPEDAGGGALWEAMNTDPESASAPEDDPAPETAELEPGEDGTPEDGNPAAPDGEDATGEIEQVEIDEQKIVRPKSPEEAKTAAIFSLVHRWIPDADLIRQAYRATTEKGMPLDETLGTLGLALHEFQGLDFAFLRLFNLPAALEFRQPGEEEPVIAIVIRVNDEFLVLSDPVEGGFVSTNTEFPHRWTGRAWLVAPNDETALETLERGSEGLQVRQLERRLARLGFLDDIADENYNRATAHAVKEFQEDYRLDRTGKADLRTQILLFSMTSEFILPTLELKVAEGES